MTLEEKVALVSGHNFMYTNRIPRLGIPSLGMADGPHGLRKQKSDNAISNEGSEPATAFPTASATANSWDEELLSEMGEAIAGECKNYGVGILLGPGTNIKRNPLCGRNFEYFSEDPLLAGKLSAAMIRGVDSMGVGVSLKHYSMNNSELYRFMGDSLVDKRAMREIYLKPFEIAVKESSVATVMCAYNKVNGTYCSENKMLLNDILRDEWGFSGAVMSDWGAVHDRVKGIEAGLDLEMPGDTAICRKWLYDAVKDSRLEEKKLDTACERILTIVEKYAQKEKSSADFEKNDRLAMKIAERSAVLMKNNGALPLDKKEKIAVVGTLFEKMRYQGAGSSLINSTKVTSVKDAFDNDNIDYNYYKGYSIKSQKSNHVLINEALEGIKNADKVLVFMGLTDYDESEAVDREHMRLAENQLELIDALLKSGKSISVVLFGGGVVELPFKNDVDAILNMFLSGQRGGEACKKLLFGEVSPSGKLAESWPEFYSDVPYFNEYSKDLCEPYKESIYVGYRYYSTVKKKTAFPFGYGLSYTDFSYENMSILDGEKISVNLKVTNIGERDGWETIQVYSRKKNSRIYRPSLELRAFKKLYLKAKESQNVNISFDKALLSYYNPKKDEWEIEDGEYEIIIAKDSETELFSSSVKLENPSFENPYSEITNDAYKNFSPEKISDEIFSEMSGLEIKRERVKLPITLESPFVDLNETFFGKMLYSAVMSIPKSKARKIKKMPEGEEKDNAEKSVEFLERIFKSNSLISMSMSSGTMFPYNLAEGFVNIANGKILRGLKNIIKGVKAPMLPEKQNESKTKK